VNPFYPFYLFCCFIVGFAFRDTFIKGEHAMAFAEFGCFVFILFYLGRKNK
jgi:hypothetical protein